MTRDWSHRTTNASREYQLDRLVFAWIPLKLGIEERIARVEAERVEIAITHDASADCIEHDPTVAGELRDEIEAAPASNDTGPRVGARDWGSRVPEGSHDDYERTQFGSARSADHSHGSATP